MTLLVVNGTIQTPLFPPSAEYARQQHPLHSHVQHRTRHVGFGFIYTLLSSQTSCHSSSSVIPGRCTQSPASRPGTSDAYNANNKLKTTKRMLDEFEESQGSRSKEERRVPCIRRKDPSPPQVGHTQTLASTSHHPSHRHPRSRHRAPHPGHRYPRSHHQACKRSYRTAAVSTRTRRNPPPAKKKKLTERKAARSVSSSLLL